MAIYSLNLGFLSRSEGRSSVGFSAYISGGRITDVRTGNAFDYSHKKEVVAGRVLAPIEAPSWMRDRAVLWNHVESYEDQIANLRFQGGEKSQAAKEKFLSSAQTAQTVMGAIPLELNQDQAESCVEAFLRSRFVSRGLIVDYALHWDSGNPHFHALVTRRPLKEKTFSQRKDREIVSREGHKITRKQWEAVVNKHLERAGQEVRIDCRSHEERGSFFHAMEHEGWHAQRLAERGRYARLVKENEEIRRKNIQILLEKPEALIQEVSSKRVTFTKRHIEDEIIRRVGGDETLFSMLKSKIDGVEKTRLYDATEMQALARQITSKLLVDERVVYSVGENFNREKIFTSQEYKAREEDLLAASEKLNLERRAVPRHWIEKAIENSEDKLGSELSKEQKQALRYLCSGSDLRVLNGKAGTGKTTLLKAVAEAYAKTGYTVRGTSFQGKAVEIMQQEIGIPCRTLDSYVHQWKQHERYTSLVESGKLWGQPYLRAHQRMKALEKHRFKSTDVILVDEANMISSKLWNPFLKEASRAGAKVIVVQDLAQIKARDVGDIGRLLANTYGYTETKTVIRQKVDWQKEVSAHLNTHEFLEGLKPYYDKGHINWFMNSHSAMMKLAQDYVKGSGSKMALAYTNQEVRKLNAYIREMLKNNGQLTEHFQIHGVEYSIGDHIRFTQNDNHGRHVKNIPDSFKEHFFSSKAVGVKNGSLGKIISFSKSTLTVKLEDDRFIKVKTKEYASFTYGYAMTMHKSEGSTFDRTYALPSRYMDPSTTLVTMTRHKYDVQVYVNSEQFVDFKDLVETCSQGKIQETLKDYHISPDQQPYRDQIVQYKDLMSETMTLREEMESVLKPSTPLFKHPSYEAYKLCLGQKKEVARKILNDWEKHQPFTRLAGLRKDFLEVEIGRRHRLLSDLEKKAQFQVEIYKNLSQETKSLWSEIQKTYPGVLGNQHTFYAEYQEKKGERNSLAYTFTQTPQLYQQFLRAREGGPSVSWQAVTAQSKAHLRSESEHAFVQALSPAEKETYNLTKAYVTARNTAAALYAQVKDLKANASLQGFKQAQHKRDELALQVIATDSDPFFKRLNLMPEKVLVHATHGDLRNQADAYQQQTDPKEREAQALSLLKSLTDKTHYRVLREAGVDPTLLRKTRESNLPHLTTQESIQKHAIIEHFYEQPRSTQGPLSHKSLKDQANARDFPSSLGRGGR